MKPNIAIQIEYKNIKTMNLRVIAENKVLVRANPKFTKKDIQEFVESRRPWIEKQMQRKAQEIDNRLAGFFLLGKPYQIQYTEAHVNEMKIVEDKVLVYHKADITGPNVLNRELSKLCYHTIEERLTTCLASFPKLPKPQLTIKTMKSKWGSCTYRENHITLNAYLIHVDLACIDYVIAHELMHFYYPDHQAGFHAGMAKVMPDYRQRRKRLREFEYLLRS